MNKKLFLFLSFAVLAAHFSSSTMMAKDVCFSEQISSLTGKHTLKTVTAFVAKGSVVGDYLNSNLFFVWCSYGCIA